jgi:hypothetical protein
VLHLKASFKIPDYTFHSGADSFDFRLKASPWWNRDFIDRYLQLECGFQLNLTVLREVGTLDFKEEEWVLTFQKIDPDPFSITEFYRRRGSDKPAAEMGREGCDNMRQSMPVLPGAVVEQEQVIHPVPQTGVRRVWSVVRLYGPDPINEIGREFPFVESGSVKSFLGVANREFEAIWFGGRVGVFEEYCSLIDRGIKSSSHVVKELAQLKSEAVIPRSLGHSTHASICPIAIWLSNELVGIWLGDSLPFSLKGFEVKACPIQSLPTLRKEPAVHIPS